jgi:predicted alpha/beta superfamily hydrolase
MSTDPIITDNPSVPVAAQSLRSRLRKHEQFGSRLLHQKRDFIVYLPPMYDAQPDRRYPVLFMQDGQNLFHPETSFIRGNYWHLGETADELVVTGQIEPLIIVGIYNTGVHRINEYAHLEDKRWGGGQADAYGQMLVEELKPFLDHSYRTLPGAENCGIGGSSMGGLVSLYLGLRYTWVFGKVAAMSPSVWWHGRAILKTIAQIQSKPDLRIWLDIGTREARRDVRVLKRLLTNKGWKRGIELAYTEAPGGEHSEWAWALRVAPMLKFLFPPR